MRSNWPIFPMVSALTSEAYISESPWKPPSLCWKVPEVEVKSIAQRAPNTEAGVAAGPQAQTMIKGSTSPRRPQASKNEVCRDKLLSFTDVVSHPSRRARESQQVALASQEFWPKVDCELDLGHGSFEVIVARSGGELAADAGAGPACDRSEAGVGREVRDAHIGRRLARLARLLVGSGRLSLSPLELGSFGGEELPAFAGEVD